MHDWCFSTAKWSYELNWSCKVLYMNVVLYWRRFFKCLISLQHPVLCLDIMERQNIFKIKTKLFPSLSTSEKRSISLIIYTLFWGNGLYKKMKWAKLIIFLQKLFSLIFHWPVRSLNGLNIVVRYIHGIGHSTNYRDLFHLAQAYLQKVKEHCTLHHSSKKHIYNQNDHHFLQFRVHTISLYSHGPFPSQTVL